jgi:cytochrome c-type biogenesis protein CcsB
MAALSDHLLVVAILGYTLAMLAYAVEYTFGDRGVVARVATRQEQRVLVGASAPSRVLTGAGGPPEVETVEVDDEEEPPGGGYLSPNSARIAGRIGLVLTVLAWMAQVGCVVSRGFAAHRVPWGNMYEFVLAVCLVGATSWLVLLWRRPTVRPLGLYASLVLAVLLGIDGMLLYTSVGPLQPVLNSYWLKIHVTAAVTASGLLMVGFVVAAMALIRYGYEAGKDRFPYTLGEKLPAAANLERLAFRLHALAFPIWTFAIICGAIWAEAAWSRYWSWDPKETWSFIAWVIYAGYLHARATPSVKRPITLWIAVLGWCAMMVNLFAINLVVSGLHSYAGV